MNKFISSIILLIIFSCSHKEDKSSTEEKNIAIKSGYDVFHERCTSCHGVDGKLCFGGAKDLTSCQKSLEEIKQQVIMGKGAMPPFKNILSSSEIDSVSLFAFRFSK